MATWDSADGDLAFSVLGNAATTDGTSVYYKKAGDQIYEYTPPSTHTALTADTAYYNPTYWNGGLYALTHDFNNYLRVHKYSGSGTTWDQVLEISSANIESPSRLIFSDTHLLVVVGLDADPWVTGRHTTDGSTWGTTTFEDSYTSQVTPDYSTQIGNDAGNARTCNHWQGFGDKQPVTQLNGNIGRIVQFNGVSEWLTRATISGDDEFVAADQAYFWRETGAANVYEYTGTYTGSWTTPGAGTIVPISQAGFDVPIGFLRSGSFVYFCYWSSDDANWVNSGESIIGLLNAYDFLDTCIRLDSGTVLVHWSRQAAHGWNVRSEAMDADPDPGGTIPLTANGLRYLRLAADSAYLYYTGIENGTISAWHRALVDLIPAGTGTFGTADFASPDSQTAGLYPVTRPGADGAIYVFGRDGSNKPVYFNDLNGTLGWQDIGAGTATWDTTKFCAALLPDVLNPPDVIAAFSDGDIYRTDDNSGTGNWVNMGTAAAGTVAVGLRQAGLRYALAGNETMAAGTAAGSIMYTPNYGVSWDEVGGTAIGTINWIAESY